jgi:hypothetical protein
MTITAPPTVATLPTPPQSTDPTNFDSRADAFLTALVTFGTQLVALALNVYNNASEAYTALASYVTQAQNARDAAQSAATTALGASTATVWASGTYTAGTVTYSPSNGLAYRNKTAGSRTVDPASDPTNWWPTGASLILVRLTGAGPTTYTARAKDFITLETTAASTVQFPAGNPGDSFDVVALNSLATNVLDPGSGVTLNGVSGQVYLDTALGVPATFVCLNSVTWRTK